MGVYRGLYLLMQAAASSRIWSQGPRLRFRSKDSKAVVQRKPSMRWPRRRTPVQPQEHGHEHEHKNVLLRILAPEFIVQLLRILTQSAAQVCLTFS